MSAASRSEISAEWARISKVAGSAVDFDILASSRAFLGPQELADFSATFVPGIPNPTVDLRSPSALPWVTFGTHLSAGRRFVSVAVQLPWDGVDQSGRPIWPRNFFVLAYDDVAKCDVSFQTLYQSIQGIELSVPNGQPVTDRRPLQLKPEPQRLPALVPVIQRYGFERLAAIAAGLLDAPVAVRGAAVLGLEERLQLLDAIVALVPRGFRASLSASSAVSGLNAPNMRLILTDEEDDEHQQMELYDAAAGPLSDGARKYYELLLRRMERPGLPEILRYLWRIQGPLYFPEPERKGHPPGPIPLPGPGLSRRPKSAVDLAYRMVFDMDRGAELDRKARDPAAIDLPFALEYFGEPWDYIGRNWGSLPDSSRSRFLELLLGIERSDTTAALVKTWQIVARDLIALAIRDLDQGSTVLAERGLRAAKAVGQPTFVDQYLEYILVSWLLSGLSDTSEERWPAYIRLRVALLLAVEAPSPGEYAETRRHLRVGQANGWQARLVRALIGGGLSARNTELRAHSWALWLSGSADQEGEEPQDWLTALDFIVGKRGSVGAAATAIEEITRVDPGWTLFLTRLAQSFDRLPDAIEHLGSGFIRCALQPIDMDAFLSVLEIPFLEAGVVRADLAWVDGARLLAGLEARFLPQAESFDLFSQYAASLGKVLHFLANFPEPRNIIQNFLLQHAFGLPHNGDKQFPRTVVKLIKDWAGDPILAPMLARYIQVTRADAALLAFNQLAPEDWGKLAVYVPEFLALQSTGSLRSAVYRIIEENNGRPSRETYDIIDDDGIRQVGVRSSPLAVAIYDACAQGMSPAQILNVMSGVKFQRTPVEAPQNFLSVVSPGEFWDILRDFQSLLRNRPIRHEGGTKVAAVRQPVNADAILIEFLRLIISNRIYGKGCADLFWETVETRTKEGQQVYEDLRRAVRPRRSPHRLLHRVKFWGRKPDEAWVDSRLAGQGTGRQATPPGGMPRPGGPGPAGAETGRLPGGGDGNPPLPSAQSASGPVGGKHEKDADAARGRLYRLFHRRSRKKALEHGDDASRS